jgi:hypothetical protein
MTLHGMVKNGVTHINFVLSVQAIWWKISGARERSVRIQRRDGAFPGKDRS